MAAQTPTATGPDFAQGVATEEIPDNGTLLGHVGDEPVLLARQGDEVFAVGATCTHYGGALADGIVVGKQVRCPLHHACFDLRTGEAVGAPALAPIACYRVDHRGSTVKVGGRTAARRKPSPAKPPRSIVIVGAGAAGHAAALTLRSEGYDGPITLVGAEDTVPVDRPNLSKDYLAGNAPAEWLPLSPREFFKDLNIDLHTGVRVANIQPSTQKVVLTDGRSFSWEALLLATGCELLKLDIPGAAESEHLYYLRTQADCQAIIDDCKDAKQAVVIGAGFIGLEAAASLRTRGLRVTVVGPEPVLLEKILGSELGAKIQSTHESHGVEFKLGCQVASIDPKGVVLDDGTRVNADFIVAGIGVRPQTDMGEMAGCQLYDGILVDEYLHTSAPGVWAAGDVARFPDRFAASTIRVEHWVTAQRQGQRAARNILGQALKYLDVPFFWSQHFDLTVRYVGHAERWDQIQVNGSIADSHCIVTYWADGHVLAAATIGRDKDSLSIEQALIRGDQAAILRVLRQFDMPATPVA